MIVHYVIKRICRFNIGSAGDFGGQDARRMLAMDWATQIPIAEEPGAPPV